MYVETHIQRVSEDPEAFVRMMQYAEQEHGCVFECNGDLSHYLYRGFANDKGYMPLIFSRVGHMHMRMARQHGDLSGAPPDLDHPYAAASSTGFAAQIISPLPQAQQGWCAMAAQPTSRTRARTGTPRA